jgi:hypothetical protein
VTTQHSLPSGRYTLLGPDFHRLDRTSLRLAHSLDDLCLKRDEALERVVEIFLKGYDEEEEELNKALDVLTVAHIKATFEQFSSSFSS